MEDELLPDPEAILIEAENAPHANLLDPYMKAIFTLRRKRYSWREIAEWLTERGIQVSHNTVYRTAKRHMSGPKGYEQAAEEEEIEREKIEDEHGH